MFDIKGSANTKKLKNEKLISLMNTVLQYSLCCIAAQLNIAVHCLIEIILIELSNFLTENSF